MRIVCQIRIVAELLGAGRRIAVSATSTAPVALRDERRFGGVCGQA